MLVEHAGRRLLIIKVELDIRFLSFCSSSTRTKPLSQTGWFIESLATQVLVIFVLRTRRNPLKSRPHPLLAATAVAVVVRAVVLPFTPLGARFCFVPPPATFLFAIAGLSVSYLLLAQGAKWAFYRLWRPAGAAPAPSMRAQLPLLERS